jgi:hypothetical protein
LRVRSQEIEAQRFSGDSRPDGPASCQSLWQFGTDWEDDVRWRKMREKGLRFAAPASNNYILFRTECSAWGVEPHSRWTRWWDVPPDTCRGVFHLRGTGPEGLELLVTLLTEINFQIQYDNDDYARALGLLQAQHAKGEISEIPRYNEDGL